MAHRLVFFTALAVLAVYAYSDVMTRLSLCLFGDLLPALLLELLCLEVVLIYLSFARITFGPGNRSPDR